jgi:ribosomal protein S5
MKDTQRVGIGGGGTAQEKSACRKGAARGRSNLQKVTAIEGVERCHRITLL